MEFRRTRVGNTKIIIVLVATIERFDRTTGEYHTVDRRSEKQPRSSGDLYFFIEHNCDSFVGNISKDARNRGSWSEM